MEYRVLGPLEVKDGDRAVNLGGPKPRALVAILLAARGHPASTAALADDLWAGDPPSSANSTLQAYVSRLRAVLPPETVLSEAGGYSLRPRPEELDADRFEAAVASGRAAAMAGDTEEALRHLDNAEVLWRGPALPELADSPSFRPEAVRLDELRFTAVEERLALELESGRHAEVVPRLEALAQQHPLREHLHALLMLALYRSGRQTDALRAFQSARAHLAEEVGLDPGPELVRLETAILAQDPALDRDGRSRESPAIAPSRLPAALTSFLGRSAELADLASFVAANRLVTLVGAGGAGKSRLALEVATEWAADRPETWVGWVELVSVDQPESIPSAIRSALGLTAEGVGGMADVAEQIGPSRGLLVVDNAEHLLEPTAAICIELLTACPELRIIATSRAPFGAAGEAVWRLGGLAAADALSLFSDRAGRVALPKQAEIDAVCVRLDGLPLPIELAAARLRHMTFASLVAGLEHRLDALDEAGRSDRVPHHRTVTASVEWSLGLLGPVDLRLAQLVSIFEGGFDTEAVSVVAEAAGQSDLDVEGGLARLVDNSLVELESSGRFRMLETVRAVSSRPLDASSDRKKVADGHLSWAAALGAAILDPATDEAWWIERMAEEIPNVRAALAWSLDEGDRPDVALRLATRAASFWVLAGPLEEARRWLEAAVPRATPGTIEYARALNQLAVLAWSQGDALAAEAPARESLQIARDLNDPRWVSIGLNLLGTMALHTGHLAEGMGLHAEALEVARPLDGDTVGTCLVNLAGAHLDALEYDAAVKLLDEAARLFQEAKAYGKQGAVLYNLAVTHRADGDFAAAEDCLRTAGEIYRRLGDQNGFAYVLNGRATGAVSEGRYADALALTGEGLAIARERGDRLFVVELLMTRAKAEVGAGYADEAATSITDALSIERDIGSRRRSSEGMAMLARLAESRRALFDARAFAEQALSIARELDNPGDIAEASALVDFLSEPAAEPA